MSIKIVMPLSILLFSSVYPMEPMTNHFIYSSKRRLSKSEETGQQHKKARSLGQALLRLSDSENRYLMQHLRQCTTGDPQTTQENITNLIRALTVAIEKDRRPGSPLKLPYYPLKRHNKKTGTFFYMPESAYIPEQPPQDQKKLEESEWTPT